MLARGTAVDMLSVRPNEWLMYTHTHTPTPTLWAHVLYLELGWYGRWGRDWGYFEGQLRKSTAELRAVFLAIFRRFFKTRNGLAYLFCLPHGFRVPGGTMAPPPGSEA